MTHRADTGAFAFGGNWRSFIELVDEHRIEAATRSLTRVLGTTGLRGRRFLDVGCGSGLFSLAAHRLGAEVRSFDADGESVAAAMELRNRFGTEASGWVIERGSVLDEHYVEGLGPYDIVYAWGVLHHTGDLWKALDNVTRLVASGGTLFVAVYNDQGWESVLWRHVKRRYNASGPVMRGLLVAGSAAYLARRRPLRKAASLVSGLRAPASTESAVSGAPGAPAVLAAAGTTRERGMSARHDLRDWVGGYPFEVASPERVFSFVHAREYELRHLKTCAGGIGCNEYAFERR